MTTEIATQTNAMTNQVQRTSLLLESLTKAEADCIDWEGQYKPYSGAMMQHKLTGEVVPFMKPKPNAITSDSPEYELVIQSYEKAKRIVRKVTEAECVGWLFELSLHTADKRLSEKEYEAKFRGMAKDLLDYPALLVKETLENWRNKRESPLYFPTSGQIKDDLHLRNLKLKKMFRRISVLAGKEIEEDVKHKQSLQQMGDILANVLKNAQ